MLISDFIIELYQNETSLSSEYTSSNVVLALLIQFVQRAMRFLLYIFPPCPAGIVVVIKKFQLCPAKPPMKVLFSLPQSFPFYSLPFFACQRSRNIRVKVELMVNTPITM